MAAMTEGVARKTRCCGPDTCGKYISSEQADRLVLPGAGRYCIASECMAWRISEQYSDMGYCGLAGRPGGEEEVLP